MKYLVGIDGGGTTSTIQVQTIEGKVLLKEAFGPMNANGNPEEMVRKTVREILTTLKQLPESLAGCQVICLGAAGISNTKTKNALNTFFREEGYTSPLLLVSDAETALRGALGKPEGCILIAGTGSIALGKNKVGNTHRTGGWGYIIDDLGSGYYIGREILSAVVQSYDNRLPKTVLTQLVYEKLGISTTEELIHYIYEPTRQKKEIAGFASLLANTFTQNDMIVKQIINNSVAHLSHLALTVIKELSLEEERLAFLGSVLQKNPQIKAGVRSTLREKHPKLEYTEPIYDATMGACLLAEDYLKQPPTY